MQETRYQPAAVEEPPVYSENTVEANDKPPKYDSLYAQLKSAKADAKNPAQFVTKSVSILTGSIWLTIGLLFGSAVSIAMIVIGSINIGRCRVERYIPIWLIVFGSVSLFSSLVKTLVNIIQLVKRANKKEHKPSAPINCLNNLISLFLFGWFIAGNVWVYSNYRKVIFDYGFPERYCDQVCYLFAFWVINITWGLMAFTCFCLCGVICCIGGLGILACTKEAREQRN